MTSNPASTGVGIPNANPLGYENIGKLITRFAVPSVISMLVNSLYNIVDQIFIGQGVGFLGNAATNVAFPIVTISMALSLLIGDGGAAFFSLNLGRQDKELAAKGVGNTLMLAIIASIIFVVAGNIFMDPLLILFGGIPNVLPYAQAYTRIILLGLPFVMVSIAMSSSIRADGSPRYAMAAMLTGAIMNTILDPIFIFVFEWGVEGAAWATIIGQFANFLITIAYLPRFKNFSMKKALLRLEGAVVKRLLSLGVSSFINQLAITLIIIVMNNSLTKYGAQSPYGQEIPLAALGIVMKVNQILISVMVGIGVGAQPIVGYNYGARNWARVKKTYLTSVVIVTICCIIGFIMFQFFPQAIINLFGQEDDLYNDFAQKCFRIFLMFCILNGFQTVSSIFFQAIGKPIFAILLSLSRQVLFMLPSLLILPHIFGLNGILFSAPVADFAAFVLASILIIREMKKLTAQQKLDMQSA